MMRKRKENKAPDINLRMVSYVNDIPSEVKLICFVKFHRWNVRALCCVESTELIFHLIFMKDMPSSLQVSGVLEPEKLPSL